MTVDGRPSGTNAMRIETAKVNVYVALPLYTAVMPTMRNTIARMIVMVESNITKWAQQIHQSARSIPRALKGTHISTASGDFFPVSLPVSCMI